MKVALCGSNGKMGQTFYDYYHKQFDIIKITRTSVCINDIIDDVDLVVDFTNGISAFVHGVISLTHKVPILIGTTGIREQHKRTLCKIANNRHVGCILCSNFSDGMLWIKRSTMDLKPCFKTIHIYEAHHQSKFDTPSGTALDLAILFDVEKGSIRSTRDNLYDVRHSISFENEYETLTITHSVNNRIAYMKKIGEYIELVMNLGEYKEI